MMTMTTIKKILVADDNEILGSSIARHLHRQGFNVSRICDVDLAQKTILAAEETGEPFDLVIIDILMQNKNGIAFIHWLHTYLPGVAILAVSGFGNAALLDTLIRPGHDSFRKKPILPKEIMEAIFSLEQKKQNRLELHALAQESGKMQPLQY